jgi:hypothetical protein
MKKALNLNVPEDLYYVFAQRCLEHRITKTEAIIRYMQYLKTLKSRKLLDENSEQNFDLDAQRIV